MSQGCYLFSTLLYGAKVWTPKQQHLKEIETSEVWCYGRMYRLIGKECEDLNAIKKTKFEFLAHIIRGPKYALLRHHMDKNKAKES